MALLPGFRTTAVQALHAAFKNRPLEELLRVGYARAPASLRAMFPRLAPQPSDYAPGEARDFYAHGLHFRLSPNSYFQWHQYFGFDDPVLAVLGALAARSRTIVDVGANVGLYSLVMARAAGPGGTVHAFEPLPATLAVLRAQLELNADRQVEPHALALGETVERRRIFVASSADIGKSSLVGGRAELDDGGLDVDVTTLDRWAEGRPPIDLLKVDVEGLEPQVFRGARAVLRASKPHVVLELSPEWWAESERGEVFGELDELGYALHEIPQPDAPAQLTPRRWSEVLAARSRQWNLLALTPTRGELSRTVSALETAMAEARRR